MKTAGPNQPRHDDRARNLMIAWTCLIALSLAWNIQQSRFTIREKARVAALTLYELNLAYRKWSTSHGGVYVPVTDVFKPNPHLRVPYRDVTTLEGKELTLVNPAWMTRSVFEVLADQSSLPVRNHLTSLRAVNPVNRPDEWEELSLRKFEQGSEEAGATVTIDGEEYMRVLKPFVAEEGCLKCHGHQGYRTGDILGGISIAVPLKPYEAARRSESRTIAATHGLFWIIGMSGFMFFERKIRQQRALTAATENQLRQAQKMEAVGQLAGGVAHDFNNILTAVIGYANLLKYRIPPDDPLRHNVDQILSSSERAARLTQSLLTYSRKQIIDPKPVDLNELIGNLIHLLKRLIGEDIELEARLGAEPLVVMADSVQIDQALMNLSTNARDAMPGGGTIQIETSGFILDGNSEQGQAVRKPGPYALVSVSDTGTGMDEATRVRIFDPFFTTKDAGKGTGLGLSMVYGIVEQHGGFITVYSEPGRGTTFKLYLPLLENSAGADAPPAAAESPRGCERILLAEDDEAVRNLTMTILSEAGYSVVEARNGEDAMEQLNRDREIGLAVLDVIMPRMNGMEVYRKARAMRPDLKVLFMSGYTADIMHKKGILEQGLNFIAKPAAPQVLLRKVRSVLDGRDERDPGVSPR